MQQSELERITLKFPKSLSSDEFIGALLELAKSKNYEFRNGSQRGFINIIRDPESGEWINDSYISEMNFTVTRFNQFTAFPNFSLGKDHSDFRRFSSLSFFTIPGHDLNEINPEELALIDQFKADLQEYLSSHYPKQS